MTEEVTKKKPGRKPKAVVEKVEETKSEVVEAETPAADTAKDNEVKELPETPVEPVEEVVEKSDTDDTTKEETPQEEAPEAPVEEGVDGEPEEVAKDLEETKEETVVEEKSEEVQEDTESIVTIELNENDSKPEETVKEITQSFISALADEIHEEVLSLPIDTFKPILRPTNVAGEPVGHMPCPRAIFDLVTTDPEWQSKIETSNAKIGLQSVQYWLEKNGKLKVRCMSTSKFGEVL